MPAVGLAQDPAPSFVAAPGAVTLVGYTTPREAYAEIIPLFQATEAGAGVTFEESYGPSGDQSRASRPACPRTSWRWPCGRTWSGSWSPASSPPDWDDNEHKGIVHNSVVAFAVRPATPRTS